MIKEGDVRKKRDAKLRRIKEEENKENRRSGRVAKKSTRDVE